MTTAVSVQSISKSFKKKSVLTNFDLTVNEGDIVAITGPSGSGKTTLLNILGLIESYDTGQYMLFGKNTPKVNSRAANKTIRHEISYLFQNFALVDNLTVYQNLMMALTYSEHSKADKKEMIADSLEQVGLKDYQDLFIYEISGGEQQRIALARAILKPGRLILADEPTGSLDNKNRDEILQILLRLNKLGKTVIVVTHDDHVAQKCHRVISIPQIK